MWPNRTGERRTDVGGKKVYINALTAKCCDQTLTMGGWCCWPLWRADESAACGSSGNLLMRSFKQCDFSLLSHLLLLCPSIQMGAARDGRIGLYWPRLNAALMKAHADNSFFIMSLARLGISFSVAEREKSWFTALPLVRAKVRSSIVRLEYEFSFLFYITFPPD